MAYAQNAPPATNGFDRLRQRLQMPGAQAPTAPPQMGLMARLQAMRGMPLGQPAPMAPGMNPGMVAPEGAGMAPPAVMPMPVPGATAAPAPQAVDPLAAMRARLQQQGPPMGIGMARPGMAPKAY
jgi:hypothetical protein